VGVALQVFGHRGACGYLPENTMESFELAFELGCDAIEFDVVLTKDSVPLIRHDLDFSITTDIAKHSLASNSVDQLLLRELEPVRAKERYPDTRIESAAQDGKFAIPTLGQVLANPSFNGKHLIVELKYGKHFRENGFDLVGSVLSALSESDHWSRDVKITIECFEFSVLQEARDRIGKQADFVFLSAFDMLPVGYEELTDELLDEIAENFDGLSVHYSMVLDSDLVARAKARGLVMYTYTARIETAEGDVKDWFKRLASTGVDGIFCDQPDIMIDVVRPKI